LQISIEDGGTACIMRLEGDIEVKGSEELKKSLLQAISSSGQLQVDLSQATEVDLTALQLFWSAVREAEKLGVSLAFAGASSSLLCALRDAGFDDFLTAPSPKIAEITSVAVPAERADD
jgi:anti-anti-sigma factor